MSSKIILGFLFFFILGKSLLWLFMVPIFQSPDEASHFAYVQRLAEGGKFNPRRTNITSKEIIQVAEIVGFNWARNHPYWLGYQPFWQEKIQKIEPEAKKDFDQKYLQPVGQRAKKNPPLYYYLATLFYYLFYSSNFLYRFFSVRFFSLIISLITLFLIYQIGVLIFQKRLEVITLIILVAYQPMFSYLGVSVNSEVLAILLVTLFIFFGLKALKEGKKNNIVLALLTVFIGILVKPIIVILFLVFPLILKKRLTKGFLFSLIVILTIFLAGSFLINLSVKDKTFDLWRYQIAFADYQASLVFLIKVLNKEIISKLINYFINNKETYLTNIFPGYWGVFGWLEAAMPITVYRILKVICGFSFLGIIKWFWQEKQKFRLVFFLLMTVLFYLLAIIFNDFKTYVEEGEAFGIQGRYFLPTISAQMILLILGLKTLVPKKFHNLLSIFLVGGSFGLNLMGFLTMYRYFYG